MNSLPEIEAAIMQLSEGEMRDLSNWLQEYLNDAWDKQIEVDAKSGKLDQLIQHAKADIEANQVKPLDEILNNP
ncbi:MULTISPECIES: hypothetical protein [unclassified Nostoc]|uniref:hypothetical protein n=1 Tax=unclassified Nostoc TaxID=2593658 RepID=UPI0013D1415F|nr:MULTISPECIES: hypothetical protein [unclassified Nostoc]MBE9002240.1 hypothetical protein [Nostoc sp. LEGE 12447]NEU80402.1 hypothetical protein [Nostoc sp. UIC 10630]